VRLPICKAIFGRKFSESRNAYFLLSFSDPLEKPLDGFLSNLRTNPSQSGPTSCHIWRQSTFGRFKDYAFNKKRWKNASKIEQPSVPAYAGTGGCNNTRTVFMLLPSWLRAIARVHPIHAMNAEQRQMAADLWTKPTELSHKSACRWLGNWRPDLNC